MLPIWERWGDHSLNLRLALEQLSDNAVYDTAQYVVLYYPYLTHPRAPADTGAQAAALALRVCHMALTGYPFMALERIGRAAVRWDEEACNVRHSAA